MTYSSYQVLNKATIMILFIGLVSPSPQYCPQFLFTLRVNIWQSLKKDYLLSHLILPPNFQKERNEKVVFSAMQHHIPTKSLIPLQPKHLSKAKTSHCASENPLQQTYKYLVYILSLPRRIKKADMQIHKCSTDSNNSTFT